MSKKQKYGSHEGLSHPTLSYYTTPRPMRGVAGESLEQIPECAVGSFVPELPPMGTLNFQNP